MADIFIDGDPPPEAEDLLADAIDFIRTVYAGWNPAEAGLVYLILSLVAQMLAPIYVLAGDARPAIFRYFGTLINTPPENATEAIATLTVTARDNLGYQLDDGSIFGLVAGGDNFIPFQTIGDAVIPAGELTVDVPVIALNAGADGSGLTTVDLTKGDSIDFIVAATVDGETTGGNDAEQTDAYLNRLSKRLEIMSPTPILPPDFAVLALDTPGIYRAVGLQGYDPTTNTWNNARVVSVAGMDNTGANIGTPVKNAIAADLESQRELNFQVFVIDSTRTQIDVEYVGVARADAVPADVKDRVNAVISEYFSALTWGDNPGEGEAPSWENTTQVRYLEVATMIENVEGFDTLTTLAIGLAGGARGQADINLPGAAPVAELGAIIGGGTVNAP